MPVPSSEEIHLDEDDERILRELWDESDDEITNQEPA